MLGVIIVDIAVIIVVCCC